MCKEKRVKKDTAMKPLFVKEISKLTKVSVRTLHYYDNIGLLKPSHRLPNGYRVYSVQDLEKLEKIIVLKFFGFTLAKINQLLSQELLPLAHLEKQLTLLQSEVSFLHEAQNSLLKKAINECKSQAHIDWHGLVSHITSYITASKLLNLKQNDIQEALSQSSKESSDYHVDWQKLITKINSSENEETP